MHVEENRRSRRLVVRLGRGETLVAGIEAAARDHAVTTAFVHGHGVLARATLDTRQPMKSSAQRVSVEGPLELVSLTGDVASHEGRLTFEGTLHAARHADHGVVVVGGHVVEAEVEGVTLLLDCLDDLGLRREAERPTGLLGFRVEGSPTRGASPVEPRPSRGREIVASAPPAARPPEPRPSSPQAEGWAAVVAASAERRDTGVAPVDDGLGGGPAEATEEPMPAVGDWVDHRQFGLCRVDRAAPDGELLIRLESGRRKEIRLDYLEVLPPRKDGARRIFPLRPRKG